MTAPAFEMEAQLPGVHDTGAFLYALADRDAGPFGAWARGARAAATEDPRLGLTAPSLGATLRAVVEFMPDTAFGSWADAALRRPDDAPTAPSLPELVAFLTGARGAVGDVARGLVEAEPCHYHARPAHP